MLMIAIIRSIQPGRMMVRDLSNGQIVAVNTNNVSTRCLCIGNTVSIWFNGIMTNSLPPQISAIRIRRVLGRGCCRN